VLVLLLARLLNDHCDHEKDRQAREDDGVEHARSSSHIESTLIIGHEGRRTPHPGRTISPGIVTGMASAVSGSAAQPVTSSRAVLGRGESLDGRSIAIVIGADAAKVGKDTDEAYRLGYDLGYEAGQRRLSNG
jgi:hypothetical protein